MDAVTELLCNRFLFRAVVRYTACDGACDIVLVFEEKCFVVFVVDEGDLDECGRRVGIFEDVEACFFDAASVVSMAPMS